MNQLIQFISRQRAIILFVLLEVLSFWCVYRFNNYPSSVYFNTSNYYVAKTLEARSSAIDYMNLYEKNKAIATENARLTLLVSQLQNQQINGKLNYKVDSMVARRFKYSLAKIIDNTVNQGLNNNYLLLDKGSADGMKPGMGVISSMGGIVGTIKMCNDHSSVVTSILHSNFMISSKIKRNGEIGTSKWDYKNPEQIQLHFISIYKSVIKGDSIVTSDYNAVFPANMPIGLVKNIKTNEDKTFFDIDIQLQTDFRNLSFVYVIENTLQAQQAQLMQNAIRQTP